MTINARQKYWLISLSFGLALLTYRLIALALEQPGFFFDEAYYYGWSLTPDWGYYSKPPMVAWSIWLSTHIFGISEFTTKLPAAVYYFATAIVIQLTTERVASPKAGLWAFIIFTLMPFVTLNSWFVTTDAPLFLCWSLTTYFYIQAEQTDKLRFWILAGVFGGLGLLSKYTMILLPASLFVMYISTGQARKLLAWKFWVTIGTALLVFSPNVIWQFLNGFPSFIHTAELANKPGWDGNPWEFIPGQLIIIGPIAAIILLSTLKARYRQQYKAIWFITWVPIFVFCLKSVQGEAFVNWAAFAYVSGCVLAGIAISELNVKIKTMQIALSLILAMVFYHYPTMQKAFSIEPTKRNTPYARVDGWRELIQQTVTIAQQYPEAYVVTESRTLNAYLSFYLPNSIDRLRTIDRDGHIANHYELFYLLKDDERPVLWLSDKPLTSIPSIEKNMAQYYLETTEQTVYPTYSRRLMAYLIE